MAEVKSAPEQLHQSKFGPVGHPVYMAALHLESSELFLVQAGSPKIAGSALLRLSCFLGVCSAVCSSAAKPLCLNLERGRDLEIPDS